MGLKEEFVHTALKPKCIASNGYIGIVKLDETYNRLKTTSNNYWKKIHLTIKGEAYFIEHGIRYYLNEFCKLTEGATR